MECKLIENNAVNKTYITQRRRMDCCFSATPVKQRRKVDFKLIENNAVSNTC